jgi:hypothetical protein
MNVENYYPDGKRLWIRLHEKDRRLHDVLAHHSAEAYLDVYLSATGISGEAKSPLFRSLDRRGNLTSRRISRLEILTMVKRRAQQAGLPDRICAHTSRAPKVICAVTSTGPILIVERAIEWLLED